MRAHTPLPRRWLTLWFLALALVASAWGQAHEHPAEEEAAPHGQPKAEEEAEPSRQPAAEEKPHHGEDSMKRHPQAEETEMAGLLGAYPATRETSGTSWQPEATPHEALHGTKGEWTWMAHARTIGVFTDQGGRRGEQDFYAVGMAMGTLRRSLGKATLGLRAMLSMEPLTVGKDGYPLLLQTGETADGRTPLIDRQHPHDLFMELAATWSIPLAADHALFLYAGLPGEPALGPPAFPHRFSAFENPEAPLGHHWLDSTHIAFGVVTAGWIAGPVKLEASAFRGREPDEERFDLESPELDSFAARLSWNPTPAWALQASYGRLESPEQLEPEVDTDRSTFSVLRQGRLGSGSWQAMLAWGRNANSPGESLDAFLLEATARLAQRHTLFALAERVENDELVDETGGEGEVFAVGALSVGYLREVAMASRWRAAVGALVRISLLPGELEEAYGRDPVSWGIFARWALGAEMGGEHEHHVSGK